MIMRGFMKRIRITILIGLSLFSAAWCGDGSNALQDFFSAWQMPKVWIAATLALAGSVLLIMRKVVSSVRLVMMAVAFFAFGVIGVLPWGSFAQGMGLHPSPMCIIEKPFLFINAGRSIPIFFFSMLAFVGLLTIISNKSFCGWTCPVGALQELIYHIPVFRKFKRPLPFALTNTIRLGVFAIFIVLVFTLSFSLFGYLNAFHILHWRWSATLIPSLIIVLIGGLIVYRPFCYLVCPLGLVTWILEPFSILRVRLIKSACTDCRLCIKKSPCPTVPSILENKKIRPDCHACGKCIQACPENALIFNKKSLNSVNSL
ncbi:MAG: 4Fe-4S binding protein [Calditrichaeota bacterium]|nr:MAG: 4Fe-4S binding protein [Calditrichota bacterium]